MTPHEIIQLLLNHLPDSIHYHDESWDWCWNELGDDAQEAVKIVRRTAWEFISPVQNITLESRDKCK